MYPVLLLKTLSSSEIHKINFNKYLLYYIGNKYTTNKDYSICCCNSHNKHVLSKN